MSVDVVALSIYLLREDVWKLLLASNEKIFNLQLHTSFLLTGWTKEKRISPGKHRSSIKEARRFSIDQQFLAGYNRCWHSKGISSDRRSFLLQLTRSGCLLCKFGEKNCRARENVDSLIKLFSNEKMRRANDTSLSAQQARQTSLSFVDRQFYFFSFSDKTKRRNVLSKRKNPRHYSEKKKESRHFFLLQISLSSFLLSVRMTLNKLTVTYC